MKSQQNARGNAPSDMQGGFDFAPEELPSVSINAPEGTWTNVEFDLREFRGQLHRAGRNLNTLPDEVIDVFAGGIDAGVALLTEIDKAAEDDPIGYLLTRLRGIDFGAGASAIESFQRYCEQHASAPRCSDAPSFKVQRSVSQQCWAMHVAGVGSVVTMSFSDRGTTRLTFQTTVASVIFPSYRDEMESIELPRSLWGARSTRMDSDHASGVTNCTQPFVYGGRCYAVSATTYSGSSDLVLAQAWRLCLLQEWAGPRYKHDELLKLWEYGERQRGDQIGLVIQVGGRSYVVDRGLEVYDPFGGVASVALQPHAAEPAVADDWAAEGDYALEPEFDLA